MNHLETIGLGLAITKLQFVAQVKRHQYSYGFKTVIHIRFKRTCTDELKDNPIPKVLYKDDGTRRSRKIGKNWKKFLHWAESWDAYDDSLKSI